MHYVVLYVLVQCTSLFYIVNGYNTTTTTTKLPHIVLGNGINIGVEVPSPNGRIDIVPPTIGLEPCKLITISGSKMALVNGLYNKVNTTDSMLSLYRRVGTRPSVVVGLSDKWCLTMSFMKFDASSLTMPDVQSKCVDLECCLLISERHNGLLLTDSSRVWRLNMLNERGKVDQSVRILCSDTLTQALRVGQKSEQTQIQSDSVLTQQPEQVTQPITVVQVNSTVVPVVLNQEIKQGYSQVIVDTCDMVSCPGELECLTKVDCPNCNPICNPKNNQQLSKVVDITCQMVKCPRNLKCQRGSDKVVVCGWRHDIQNQDVQTLSRYMP